MIKWLNGVKAIHQRNKNKNSDRVLKTQQNRASLYVTVGAHQSKRYRGVVYVSKTAAANTEDI